MYYIVIWISVIWYILSNIFFAKHSRKIWSNKVNLYKSISLSLMFSPLLFFINYDIITTEYFLLSFIFWIFWVIYFMFHLKAYEYLPVWIVSALISLESVIVLGLGFYIYDESFSSLWYLGSALLILSWLMLSLFKVQFKHLKSNWKFWILLSLIAAVWASWWWFGFAYISREYDIYSGILWSELSMLIIYIMILWFTKNGKKIWNSLKMKEFFTVFKVSIFYAIAISMYFYSVLLWSISTSILFLSSIPIFVSILGVIYYKEILNKYQWSFIIIGFIWLLLINIKF